MSDPIHEFDHGMGRRQAGLANGDAAAAQGHRFGSLYLQKATVIAVRYPEQAGSQDRNEVTYDIIMHMPRERRTNVPRLNLKSGVNDGDENTLHPAFTTVDGSQSFDVTQDLHKLDGDVVLVDFVNGDSKQPVIIGALTHPSSTYKGSAALGERRFMQHKGTSVTIDQNGNVTVVLASSAQLKLGDSAAGNLDTVTLASVLASFLSSLISWITGNTALLGHTHTLVGVQAGGSTLTTAPNASAPSGAPAIPTLGSSKVQVSK